VLGYGSVTPSCNACHNSATHYNSITEVSIPSSFDDRDSGSPNFNGSTCSNTRCHGGRTTPSWSTGSLNVNTQCTSCHNSRDRGSNQYNDYAQSDDLHDKHVRGEGFACTECHSITKLANGSGGNTHFSNLQTTTFELHQGLTVGGSDTAVGNTWNNSSNTCSNLDCHGESHDSGMNWFK
jgi:predicted CxxxxCH...CXXCH cytochrome family protein